MYFITTKRMLEVCFSAHPNIQYRTSFFNSCFNFVTSLPGKRGAASGLFPLAEYYEKKLLALTFYSD